MGRSQNKIVGNVWKRILTLKIKDKSKKTKVIKVAEVSPPLGGMGGKKAPGNVSCGH